MSRIARIAFILLWPAGALFLFVLLWCWGFRVNLWTASLPRGIYQVTDAPLSPGTVILMCPPQELAEYGRARHYLIAQETLGCPGGTAPLLKILAAEEGDTVRVTDDGLMVNGRFFDRWDGYWPEENGPETLPVTYRLKSGEIWVHGTHPRSWDSRHFGPIPLNGSASAVRPLWTWPRLALTSLSRQ